MTSDIRKYINRNEPFGPIDSREIHDKKIMESLFEQHNRMYKSLHQRPSLILGRRGSGKTSYLQSIYFERNYHYFIELETAPVFVKIIEAVQSMSSEAVFPESIAELWETAIFTTVFAELRKHIRNVDQKAVLEAYLSKMGVRDQDTIDTVLWTIADTLSENAKGKPVGLISEILKRFDKVTFEHAKKEAVNFLEKSNQRFVILLDSLDEFTLHIDSVARALQGLLKFIGSLNGPDDFIDIRFCLPSELYHTFLHISSNPNKDFRRTLLLQWIAPELMMLGAQRLLIFLQNYEPQFYQTIKHLKSQDHVESLKIFQAILPNRIRNRAGIREQPIPYILRHTQLLPRHFLILLNSIFANAEKTGNSFLPLHESDIIHGVHAVEERLTTEILTAYRPIHPKAEAVCKRCIPELPHRFSFGDLERVFRTHGKSASESNEFFDFKRMLIEIGAVGRVIGETEHYIKGLFEYTVPHELVTSTDDDLCIHPLFSGVFSSKPGKPVYPYGSIIDDDDYRDS